MLKLITNATLEKLEHTEKCKTIRSQIIDESFEANAKDYMLACNKLNEMGEAYFSLGFEVALKMMQEVQTINVEECQ